MSDEWEKVERVVPPAGYGWPPQAGNPQGVSPQQGWQTVPAPPPMPPVPPQGYGVPPPPPSAYPAYAPPPAYGAPQRKSHIVRNVVLIVLAFVLLGMAGCGALVYKGMTLLRDSAPARLAVHTAESSPFVQERIGTPLRPSWFISGNINSSLNGGEKTGSANMKINVTGPKGEGTLLANEKLTADGWKIVSLTYQDAGSGSTPLVQTPVQKDESY